MVKFIGFYWFFKSLVDAIIFGRKVWLVLFYFLKCNDVSCNIIQGMMDLMKFQNDFGLMAESEGQMLWKLLDWLGFSLPRFLEFSDPKYFWWVAINGIKFTLTAVVFSSDQINLPKVFPSISILQNWQRILTFSFFQSNPINNQFVKPINMKKPLYQYFPFQIKYEQIVRGIN